MGILFDRNAFTLANTYGLCPDPDLKYEPHWADNDVNYYTFAQHLPSVNVLVKFNAEDLEHEE